MKAAPQPISPIMLPDNTLTYDPNIIAEVFAKFHSSKFPVTTPPLPSSAILNFLKTPPLRPTQQELWTLTDKELRDEIRLLDPTKAAGPDGVLTTALKHLTQNAIHHLTAIFNACLRLSHYPSIWKHATVIMIQKPKKDHKQPSSYRPINLLPTPSKLFERLLLRRMTPLLTNVLRNTQFGFRDNRSAVLQTLRLALDVSTSLQYPRDVPALFTDFSSAFDSVNHEILLFKIKPYIPEFLHSFLRNYLSLRSFRVRHLSCYSSSYPIKPASPRAPCCLLPYSTYSSMTYQSLPT